MNTIASSPTTTSKKRDIRIRAFVLLLILVPITAFFVVQQRSSGLSQSQGQRPDSDHLFKPLTSNPSSPNSQTSNEEKVWQAPEPWIDPAVDPQAHQLQARDTEADLRFKQGIAMLHAKRFDEAATAFGRALELFPNNPDIYVNLGYAFLGLEDYQTAYHSFDKAMDLNPAQANAYFGAAIASEEMGDLKTALGGMRSFLHLSQDKPANQIHVARARSAIWEWEAKLGRGPWGPTQGIPPGFTEEELKRNDKGVGIKVTVPGTEDEKGNMQYEIKYSEKYELFDR